MDSPPRLDIPLYFDHHKVSSASLGCINTSYGAPVSRSASPAVHASASSAPFPLMVPLLDNLPCSGFSSPCPLQIPLLPSISGAFSCSSSHKLSFATHYPPSHASSHVALCTPIFMNSLSAQQHSSAASIVSHPIATLSGHIYAPVHPFSPVSQCGSPVLASPYTPLCPSCFPQQSPTYSS